MAITDIIQQKKEAALNNLASSTSKTESPKVKLDPLYDTSPVGDSATSFERVNLLIANPAELTWWDKNGNGQPDPDEPAAVAGIIRDIPLALGNNTIAIVQKSAGKSVSDPTTLTLYRESPLFQNNPANQYATTLQKLAIAYWGRPLTPEERQAGIDYLIKSGGNTQGIIDYLRKTPEFIAYYTTSPNFFDAITKAYQTLYHRGPTASEIAAALAQPDSTLLPALLLQSANPLDQQLLAAKVLAAEQITQNYSTLLEGAQGNTLLLNEAVRAQLSQMSVATPPGQIVAAIKNGLKSGLLPSLTATLDSADDTAPAGDNTTTKQTVTITIGNIASGALAWWDKDGNGKFDSGTDVAVVLTNPTAGTGQLTVNLQPGPNTFTFTQKTPGNDTAAPPTYLTLWRETGTTTVATPTVALRAEDDDGIPNDGVTSKSLVQLTVSGLSATRDIAWIDRDGNGAFDLTKDIAIAPGGTTQNVWVPLAEGVNGFQVYQKENGITSLPGTINIYRVKGTDVVTPGQTAAYAGTTITLEFDRPIDWQRLDTNHDGKLDIRNLNQNGDTGELQIAWGGSGNNPPQLDNDQLAATVIDPIPAYGSRFLTITGVAITAPNPGPIDGDLTLIVVGVPDVQDGITSNVIFTI